MYVPALWKVNEPLVSTLTANVSLPVFAGAPGQALDVHDVAVWPTPLALVQLTCDPAVAAALSGMKQNSNPPPEQPPEVMVIAVLARLEVGTRNAKRTPAAASAAATARRRLRTLSPFITSPTGTSMGYAAMLIPLRPALREGERGPIRAAVISCSRTCAR